MKSVRFAVLAAAAIVVGVSGVAWGSNGDPLTLGSHVNRESRTTTLTMRGSTLPALRIDAPRASGLWVQSNDSDATAVDAYVYGSHDTVAVRAWALGPGFSKALEANVAPDVNNVALQANGPSIFGAVTQFKTSGLATVPAGKNHVVVPIQSWGDVETLNDGSFALATLQQRVPGTFVLAAVPDVDTQSITIYLNRRAPSPVSLAWFVANGGP
jgi:hypothetical protein